MNVVTAVEQELNLMLDDGVNAALREEQGSHVLEIRLDDVSCVDCLVPDETLTAITRDALERNGAAVEDLRIEHLGIQPS